MNSRVSAIVSTYNSERFFTGRMENLLQQTIADRLEIVVVDSGSQQNESAIAQHYIDAGAPVKLIRTERESLYSAWNRAIEVATGDYLISANTDDRLMPEACEVMAEALDAHQQVALVFSDALETTDEQEVIDCSVLSYSPGRRRISRPAYSYVRLLVECCCGPFPMWRRSVHEQSGLFDSSYIVAGDWEFWLRIGEKNPMLHIATPLGLIARRADSILWSDQDTWKQENGRVRAKYFGGTMKQLKSASR
jgi:glycosyltransferase involved in cell wall biosynthesis